MANKKGQGISISFIVVAAIAALVLVLVIAFATGGLGKFFGNIFKVGGASGSDTDMKVVQTKCAELCNTAQMSGYGGWDKSKFCTKTFGIDLDGDGYINQSTGEILNCTSSAIGAQCMLTTTDGFGYGITCTEAECSGCSGTGCTGDLTIHNPIDCAAGGFVWEQQ